MPYYKWLNEANNFICLLFLHSAAHLLKLETVNKHKYQVCEDFLFPLSLSP